MSIFPNWLSLDLGTGGVTIIDSCFVEIQDDSIDIELDSDIFVEILDDSITVEIC